MVKRLKRLLRIKKRCTSLEYFFCSLFLWPRKSLMWVAQGKRKWRWCWFEWVFSLAVVLWRLGISAGYLHSIVLIFWAANRIARLIQGVEYSPISLSLLISFLYILFIAFSIFHNNYHTWGSWREIIVIHRMMKGLFAITLKIIHIWVLLILITIFRAWIFN